MNAVITKLEKEILNLKQLEAKEARLITEVEILERAIQENIHFYTAVFFARCFKRNWNQEKIRRADKRMAIYCLTHAIEIRKDENGTKSYPYTAWRDLGYL